MEYPMGWGLPRQSTAEIIATEQRLFGELVASMPERMIRTPAKTPVNSELLAEVKRLQQSDGIESGFSFLYLEKAIFKKNWRYRPQLIGSCVASGGIIVSGYRMLAEVFVFNEAQELLGTEAFGTNSFQPFGPFAYRAGRHFAGINGSSPRDDGSFCSAHFKGKMQIGYLDCDTPGLNSDAYPEPQDQGDYRRWGGNDQLMNEFKSKVVAKLEETERVPSAQDMRVLMNDHLKPAQICSMWAFRRDHVHPTWKMDGKPVMIYTRDKRSSWAHNMSVVGFVSVSGVEYVCIQNTWGRVHDGFDFFYIRADEFNTWTRERNTECQTEGNIEFLGPGVSPL